MAQHDVSIAVAVIGPSAWLAHLLGNAGGHLAYRLLLLPHPLESARLYVHVAALCVPRKFLGLLQLPRPLPAAMAQWLEP